MIYKIIANSYKIHFKYLKIYINKKYKNYKIMLMKEKY